MLRPQPATLAKELTMAEVNQANDARVDATEAQSKGAPAATGQNNDETEQTRLGILQAVERKEISIEEALRLLREMED
jgi:hypothetical protein